MASYSKMNSLSQLSDSLSCTAPATLGARRYACQASTLKTIACLLTTCIVPAIDGAFLTRGWKESLWARFHAGAPQRQTRSAEQCNIVKRVWEHWLAATGSTRRRWLNGRKRRSVADLPTGPKTPRSKVLSVEKEKVIVVFRRHSLLPLDDFLYALQPPIPRLTRSSLHRCMERHGIGRLPGNGKETSPRGRNSSAILGHFHIG